jgi:hypothetical protein
VPDLDLQAVDVKIDPLLDHRGVLTLQLRPDDQPPRPNRNAPAARCGLKAHRQAGIGKLVLIHRSTGRSDVSVRRVEQRLPVRQRRPSGSVRRQHLDHDLGLDRPCLGGEPASSRSAISASAVMPKMRPYFRTRHCSPPSSIVPRLYSPCSLIGSSGGVSPRSAGHVAQVG